MKDAGKPYFKVEDIFVFDQVHVKINLGLVFLSLFIYI